jgi:hypothetical protein
MGLLLLLLLLKICCCSVEATEPCGCSRGGFFSISFIFQLLLLRDTSTGGWFDEQSRWRRRRRKRGEHEHAFVSY